MLIGAIKNGATHVSNFSSRIGLLSAGCSGPVKPSESANGLAKTAKSSGFSFRAAIVAPRDAAVPPENSPFIPLTLPLTFEEGLPCLYITSFCKNRTPKSKGILSNPHENTILDPDSFAKSLSSFIFSCIHPGSPHRST